MFWLKMAPPSVPELLAKKLVVTVNVPLVSIAPPVVPEVAGEEFPVKVLPFIERVAPLWL